MKVSAEEVASLLIEQSKVVLTSNNKEVFDGRTGEFNSYYRLGAPRVAHLVNMLAKYNKSSSGEAVPLRCLEIGVSPFTNIRALRKFLYTGAVSFIGIDQPQPGWSRLSSVSEEIIKIDIDCLEEIEVRVIKMNAEQHPFPFGAEFDIVICIDVIEHLLLNPSHMIFEAHRVLKKGGIFVLGTYPNLNYWPTSMRAILNRQIFMEYSCHGPHGRHARHFTSYECEELCRGTGFVVREKMVITHKPLGGKFKSEGYTPHMAVYALDSLLRAGGKMSRWMREKAGANIVLICEKNRDKGLHHYPKCLYQNGWTPEQMAPWEVVFDE